MIPNRKNDISIKEDSQVQSGIKIKLLREHLGLTQKQFSNKTSIPLSTIGKIESGHSNVGMSVLTKIISIIEFEKFALWLIKDDLEVLPDEIDSLDGMKSGGFTISIPFYDIEASAGHGALVESDQYEKLITFSPDYIRNEIGVNPNNVFLMLARGDSMYPTIKDGAMIMVEKDLEHLNDGIFVLRLNNALLVKRLNILPTGTIKVLSDNKMYEPYEIDAKLLEADNVEVLGRVVWSGQRM